MNLRRFQFPRMAISIETIVFVFIAALCLYFVFFWHLGQPPMLFWDENYHLASENKYLAGVMFMEPHPPLGKLLMALSEWIFGTNQSLPHDIFLATDYVHEVPKGFAFWPARLPSALCAALGAVVFYLILREVTHHRLVALVFSGFYLFDNALVLHSRAAMLEGIQFFFVLLTVWWFLRLLRREEKLALGDYGLLALFTALAVGVKSNSLVLLPLFPILWGYEYRHELAQAIRRPATDLYNLTHSLLLRGVVSVDVLLIVVCAIYYVHIGLGTHVVNGRYYNASQEYKDVLDHHESTWNPALFLPALRDNILYSIHYNSGVPALKPYDPRENGSYPLRWLAGGKTINYRWDHNGDATSFLYLVGNPLAWGVGLTGLGLTAIYVIGWALGEITPRDRRLLFLMAVFLGLWLLYMGMVLEMRRVMYLYHYLIPLMFTWIMAAASFSYLFQKELQERSLWLWAGLLLLFVLNVAVFLYYAPFTYHLPLTKAQFEARNWSRLWGMTYAP